MKSQHFQFQLTKMLLSPQLKHTRTHTRTGTHSRTHNHIHIHTLFCHAISDDQRRSLAATNKKRNIKK